MCCRTLSVVSLLSAILSAVILSAVIVPSASSQTTNDKEIRRSVVKVFSTLRAPHYLRPWTRQEPLTVNGTAVVIEGGRILTNAHLVTYASQIYIQSHESSDQISAKVVAFAAEVDLALLEVEEGAKEFLNEHPGLKMSADLPQIRDVVSVYGYPVGGIDMAITKGAVTRIEFSNYGTTGGLRIDVDAAIGPGNSGGPAIVDGRMVGVVFGRAIIGQDIGYVIPTEEISNFLDDMADDRYDGKLQIFDGLQAMENDALRARLGLSKEVTGVLVNRPFSDEPGYPLKKNDVITAIGPHDIGNSGMIRVRENLRLPFFYAVPRLAKDGTVELSIMREGKARTIRLPVASRRGDFLMQSLRSEYPEYFVWGPLAFSPASSELVGALTPYLGQQWSLNESPLIRRQYDFKRTEDEQLVMVTTMLPHETSKGYGDPFGQVVQKVNGVSIRNLRHLVETIRDADGRFVEFEFAGKFSNLLVFDRRKVLDSMEDILIDNGIRSQVSAKLRDVWEKKESE